MILMLAPDHGYSSFGLSLFDDLLGTDITLEQFAELSREVPILIVDLEDAEENKGIWAHGTGHVRGLFQGTSRARR